MFSFFKNIFRPDDPQPIHIGLLEYKQFKELSRKPGLLDHFCSVCAGFSEVPFMAKDDVQKMVGLAKSLISYTGLGLEEIIECAESNRWDLVEGRLGIASSALDMSFRGSQPGLERLRSWADENDLPPLTTYDSSAYQMTGFPRDLKSIFTLRQLHLPDAGLTSLPDDLRFLRALESICIDGNKIKQIPSEIFGLHSLQRIDAAGNEIEAIPDSIAYARHLQSLDLDGNCLKYVSPKITRCQSLKRIFLRDQRHGTNLGHIDTPLSDEAMEALAALDERGVDVRF